ncbi:MAG TPA: cell division protein FtsZ [Bacteroidales bacterium]|nr:cell division protein FtsZ [Bacteroidales bacterium]
MLEFEAPKENSNYIKVIGVGGGGTNAINHMYNKGIDGVDFIVCNTDQKSIDASPIQNKIKIGKDGLGAGNCPDKAKQAAILAELEIKEMLSNNTQMLFIAAGMGGGTGTGAAPIIAKFAKEIEFTNEDGEKIEDEILVVAIVTLPLSFEGKRRKDQAEEGIRNLKQYVDAIIVVNTDKIRERGNIPLPRMFPMADDVLLTAAKGIAEIITSNAYISVDFRDVQSVMADSGVAIMGTGTGYGQGEERALEAIQQAATSDLLNDCEITGTKNMLLYITTSPDEEHSITMDEYAIIADYIQSKTGNEPDIIWGLKYDESYQDRIDITLVATGFEEQEIYNPYDRDNSIVKKPLTIEDPKQEVKPEIKPEVKVETAVDSIKKAEQEIANAPFLINTGIKQEEVFEETTQVGSRPLRNELDTNPGTFHPTSRTNDNPVSNETIVDISVLGIQMLNAQTEVATETIEEEEPAPKPSLSNTGYDSRIKPRQPISTNPHYTEDLEKLMTERQRRMEELSRMMKDKNGLDHIINTPAYEQYNMDIPVTKHSSTRESSSLKVDSSGISTNNNPYIHSNPD